MNKKYAKVLSTRRSLIMSILSLMLCFAMLLGTTYAWFTDSVTSGRNKIIAGNLDVELTHSNASVTNQKVQDATDLFGVTLWEPGVVAYENFTVANVGNLALKYALNLNVFDKNATTAGHDLTEVIKVAVVDGGFKPTGTTAEAKRAEAQALTFDTLADFQKTGNLAAKNDGNTDETTYGIVLYWEPTDNDNLYNVNNYTGEIPTSDHQPLFVEFGITLVATQDTVEADSFDTQYDKLAEFPVSAITKVETGKETTLKAYDGNNVLAAKAVIPADAQGDGGALNGVSKVEMTVDETDKPSGITLDTGEQTVSYDVKFFSVAEDGTKTPITDFGSTIVSVDLSAQIPDGADLMRVYHTHGGTDDELQKVDTAAAVTDGKFYYDVSTKILTVGSNTFSPFTFVYKTYVAKVSETGTRYGTLQEAVNAAGAGNTVELLIDYTVPTTAPIQVDKALTLDLGGFELKGITTNQPVVYVTGNGVTLTNGTITATSNVKTSWGAVTVHDGGQINDMTSTLIINANANGLRVDEGAVVKDLNCTINADLGGISDYGAVMSAIWLNGGTIEKITSGKYHAHPVTYSNTYGSDALTALGPAALYLGSGTMGPINGGEYQGVAYTIQSYVEYTINGGTFMYQYVDGNGWGKSNSRNTINMFDGGQKKPTSISGGKIFLGCNSTNGVPSQYADNIKNKLASGYHFVQAEEVEMLVNGTTHYYFWNVVAK